MRFKKLLAVAIAAAMFTATVPLSLAVSASSLEIGAEDENQDGSETETEDEETGYADNILHWTLTAKSQFPITVVPGKSESKDEDITSPSESPFDVYTIKFDLGDIEAEMEQYSRVNYLIWYTQSQSYGDYSSYRDGVAEIKDNGDDTYSFICGVPKFISEGEDYTFDKVVAYLTLGNTVAELEVDLTSDEVQSFSTENNQTLKIVGDDPNAKGTFSLSFSSVNFGSWDIDTLDTLYLPPIADRDYRYALHIDSQKGDTHLEYNSEYGFFTLPEGGLTLNLSYIIPNLENITLKLDKSELPADKYLTEYGVYSQLQVYGDDGRYAGQVTQRKTAYDYQNGGLTLDEISVLKDRYNAQVSFYYDKYGMYNYRHESMYYSFPTSLEDGDTLHLGTDFTSDDVYGYNYYEEYHPGDVLSLMQRDLTDKNENRISLYLYGDTITVPITVTFTNVDDPDDVYTIETTTDRITWDTYYKVTLPEGMDGKYDIEIFIEHTIDLSNESEDTTPSETPSVTPSNPSTSTTTTTTTSTEPEPEETAQPAVELKDDTTGVTVTSEDGTALPEGVELKVEIGTTTVVYTDRIYVLDITLVDENGEKIQPNGPVTVTIPVPVDWKGEFNYYIYYLAEDGTITYIQSTYKDGYVTFITDHFSKYILTTEKLLLDDEGKVIPETPDAAPAPSVTAAPDAENNGAAGGTDEDKNMNTGVFLAVIPMIAAAAGAVITKKRK